MYYICIDRLVISAIFNGVISFSPNWFCVVDNYYHLFFKIFFFFFFHLKIQKLSYEILQFEVGEMKILT